MSVYYSLRYTLTPKAIIERVKSSGDNSKEVGIKLSHGEEQFNRAVDLLGLENLSGQGRHVPIALPGTFDSIDVPVSALLDRLEQAAHEKEAEYAQERQKYEAEVQRLLTCDPKSLMCNRYGVQNVRDNPASDNSEWNVPQQEGFWFPSEGAKGASRQEAYEDPRLEGLRAKAKAIISEQSTRIKNIKAELEAKTKQEMTEWIASHGSSRLKRALEEGFDCTAIYRDERITLDRPGWLWLDEVAGDSKEPRNPPENAFQLLDEARKIDPTAKLRFHMIEEDEDDDIQEWRGYTAEAEFLGKTICFGIPE